MFYVCMVCEDFFESDKKPGKIEEEWSNPALCPVCNSDEVREASSKEIKKNTNAEKRGEKMKLCKKAHAELDKHIIEKRGLQGVNLLPDLILDLQVKLGECANESRCFKFWSNDQEPRTEIPIDCPYCYGKGYTNHDEVFEGGEPWPCKRCDGSGVYGYKNPLLEKYVECLRLILSIGNYLGFRCTKMYEYQCLNITNQFIKIFYDTVELNFAVQDDWGLGGQKSLYEEICRDFVGLGKMLGFTWEQVEQAFFENNEV